MRLFVLWLAPFSTFWVVYIAVVFVMSPWVDRADR